MNTQTANALKMAIEALKEAEDIIEGKTGQGGYFAKPINACKEALATNKECSVVQSAQKPISFEMDELTEEWYGVLDDKTALIIYGGNRGYWSDKIYAHSTPDSTPDSTPAIEQALGNQEGNKESNQQPAQGIELEWYNKGWTDANWEWQGLTDDEVDDFMFQSCDAENGYSITDLIRLVEQSLKDKNT